MIAATFAAPLEQEINGVEGIILMTSLSTTGERVSITVTRALGIDLDQSPVPVWNRVEIGALDYSTNNNLGENTALPLLILHRPGSNALATAATTLGMMDVLAQSFPDSLACRLV